MIEFLLERAKYILRERRGFAYDEVNAVFAAGADDLVDAAQRLSAVQAIRKTKDFEPLASAFKRIRKIVEKAGTNGPALTGKLSAVRSQLLEAGGGEGFASGGDSGARPSHDREAARAVSRSTGSHRRAASRAWINISMM